MVDYYYKSAPGAFTAEETDVIVMAVKDRELMLNGGKLLSPNGGAWWWLRGLFCTH